MQKDLPIFQVFSKKSGFFSRPLSKFSPLQSICSSCEKYFFLSESGQVFILSSGSISRLSLPVKIRKICGSKESVFFLPDQGLYFQGYDLLSSEFSAFPALVESFGQVPLKDVSLGLTHAAGIDDAGTLYIWGGSYGVPRGVSKAFTCSKVLCGDFLTAVATSGGYFYTYGWFNTLDSTLSAFSFPELEKYFVIDFCIGNNFCVVFSDDGTVVVFDSSHCLLHLKNLNGFRSAYAVSNGLFVFTLNAVYKWTGNGIRDWVLEVLVDRGNARVLGCYLNSLLVQGEIDWEVKTELGKSESFEKILSPKSLTTEKKVYSQYFPQDNSFNKILEYRKQHKIAGRISQFVQPLCLPWLRFAWEQLWRFSQIKKLQSRSRALSQLPVLTAKVIQKAIYLDFSFAFEKIFRFSIAQVREEAEDFEINVNKARSRREKFFECFKKLKNKEIVRYGEIFIGSIKFLLKIMKKRENSIKKIFIYAKKADRSAVSLKFYKWLLIYERSLDLFKASHIFSHLFLKKHGGHAMRLLKSYHFYRKFQLSKLKSAILLLYKRRYISSIIKPFNKWSQIGIKSSVLKEKSLSLYKSLAKNIYSVLHLKLRSSLKFSFSHLLQNSLHKKRVKLFRNPFLYFSTVFSKIICRLKFSTFSILSRTREKTSFTINLDSSGRLTSLGFVIEKIYSEQLRHAFEKLEISAKLKKKLKKNVKNEDFHEQTLTFFNSPPDDYQNPFVLNQTVPKLQLGNVENMKKPPISSRNSKYYVKVKPKPPSRSGSFTANDNREDSLSRRKNYDNQLRKKIKDLDKTSQRHNSVKSVEKLLAKKPPKRKYIENKGERETPKNNEEFFKVSLAVLGIRKFFEKNEFTLLMSTFKILKTCFKYSKNPYSRCFRYSPDKSNIFN